MRIDAYMGNPIIATQEQYYQLGELLHEIDPDYRSVQLRTERLIIENISRKTFHYPRNPSIGWGGGTAAIPGRKWAVNTIYRSLLGTGGANSARFFFHEQTGRFYAGEKEAKSRVRCSSLSYERNIAPLRSITFSMSGNDVKREKKNSKTNPNHFQLIFISIGILVQGIVNCSLYKQDTCKFSPLLPRAYSTTYAYMLVGSMCFHVVMVFIKYFLLINIHV